MVIRYTKHATQKFAILGKHGVLISQKQVSNTLTKPHLIDNSRLPLLIAQGPLDKYRVLRVVYRQEKEKLVVITFYPGKKSQYEK